jgi:DHA3 family tetracycline resistance protein-like MFS transporter
VPNWLLMLNAGQFVSLIVFAAAGSFWMGMVAFWAAGTLSRVYDPLYLGWLNQNVRSEVRATVLSMSSQADSFGQISGGPVIGAIGSLVSLRAALFATAMAMLPLLGLYGRAFGLKDGDEQAATVEAVVESSSGGGSQG